MTVIYFYLHVVLIPSYKISEMLLGFSFFFSSFLGDKGKQRYIQRNEIMIKRKTAYFQISAQNYRNRNRRTFKYSKVLFYDEETFI